MIKFKFCLALFLLLAQVGFGQEVSQELKPLTWQDIPKWQSISQNSFQMSSNGKWMVYAMMPLEGDGEVIVQKADESQTKKSFPIGSTNFPSIAFSENGRWLAFKQYPKESERKANSKNGDYLAYSIDAANQSGNGAYLLQLASGKTEILESDTATYKSINWTEKGEAFAMLKLVKDKSYKQDHGKV